MKRLSQTKGHAKKAPMVPVGRFGTVKEISDATVFLFSDSGNYVNGAVLVGKF
jgi:peroxisomal 2,4-dienoyl-CoA reductase